LDFDPLYTTPRADAVARFIESHYPVAGLSCCRMLHRGLNDVYLAVAANGERYIFRLSHHRARGAADVQTETSFLAHLARRGAPVAAPIQTRDGDLFLRGAAPEGMREGVLFRALEGRAPDATSAADARANGVSLALIHNAAETFHAAAPLYRLDIDHLLRRPLTRILESGLVNDARARDDLKSIAGRAEKSIEAFDNLTWTHCHGDCHGFNARIIATGEAAFFDFDDGGPGFLAYDLSVFLWAKVSFGRKLTAMWNAFVDGYREVRPIAQNDFEAAHRFVVIRHIWIMGEYASRVDEWGANSVDWIARETDFLTTWERERFDRLL
jgi:Ser/Thr protein kinase RdoA (MazF antagonist)